MDMTHGNPWGVPWDPGVGTMGAPWVGSLSLLGLRGSLGLRGPLGLMAPQGTQGSLLNDRSVALRIYNPFGVAEGFLMDLTGDATASCHIDIPLSVPLSASSTAASSVA